MKKRKHNRRPNKKTARRRPGRGKKDVRCLTSFSARRPASNKRRRSITIMPPRKVGERSLTDLAKQINTEHLKIVRALKIGLQHAITAGSLLIAAKAKLKHGQWLPWLRDNCLISERSAELYMRLARHAPEIESKVASLADLTVQEAIALIAKADESDVVEGTAIDSAAAAEKDVRHRTSFLPDAVTAPPDQPRALEQMDRVPQLMSTEDQHRFNLNQGGHYLLHIPRTPIAPYLHPAVSYSADQWDDIAGFLSRLAAAMRIAAFDEANFRTVGKLM
jgi:hypothetical protein